MPSLRRLVPHLLKLACALPVLLWAGEALARAGGGENFGDGGGGGGGGGNFGGGGGGGDGDLFLLVVYFFRLLAFLIRVTFQYPHVMGPVWVGVAVVSYVWFRRLPPAAELPSIERPQQRLVQSEKMLETGLTALAARDEGFSVQPFLERTRKVFLDIQEAWFLRRLDTARHLMSDGLYRRFTTLQALMQAEGRRDALADAKVLAARIVSVASTPSFDLLTVRIDASLRDTEVAEALSDEDARKAARKAKEESFTELWTFVRRPSAKTREGFDLGQGQCPNCGAAFSGGAANKCKYCDAVVNSGRYDWVLTEITQLSVWTPPGRDAPGLATLRTHDPDAAAEILEDRALLLFWKRLEARALARPAVLRKVAAAQAFETERAIIERDGKLPLKFPAVGSADLVAVEADEDVVRAHVDVVWSAGTTSGGKIRRHRHVVAMVRGAAARSDPNAGLSTERCGHCGAPLTQSDSTTCDYCGQDFIASGEDWLLDAVVPYDEWRPRRAPAKIRPPRA